MKNLGWRAGVILGVLALSAFLIYPSAAKRAQGELLNVNLGLDLKGGSHLVLDVVTEDALRADCDTVASRIGQRLSDDGIAYQSAARKGDTAIVISGIPEDRIDQAQEVVGDWAPGWLLSRPEPGTIEATMTGPMIRALREQAVRQSLATIRNRIDQFGVTEPSIQTQGGVGERALSRIVLQLPGVEDPSRVKSIIQTQARLEWKELVYPPGVPEDRFVAPDSRAALEAMFGGRMPPDTEAYPSGLDPAAGTNVVTWWPLRRASAISGSDLRTARRDVNTFGQPSVAFELTPDAGRRFTEITRANVGRIVAIVLDDKVISSPIIRSVIGANGIIEGNFTREEADDLALKLRSGALPARVNIVEERTVGPSLGRDSIWRGFVASLAGFAAVMLFMLIYYKASGINAVLALAINVVILLGAMSWMQATLTLPGIAGLILVIGMAVDANVLIFERIREELAVGKTVRSAIDAGFGRAWWTIVDTNVTTLAAAFFLFAYGTGPVRGFAVTLIIGLLASMFTAVFVSRFVYDFVLRNRRPSTLSI